MTHSIVPSYIDAWCTALRYILMPDSIESWMHSIEPQLRMHDATILSHTDALFTALSYNYWCLIDSMHWAILMPDAQHWDSLIRIAEQWSQLDACNRARASSVHAPFHANLALGCAWLKLMHAVVSQLLLKGYQSSRISILLGVLLLAVEESSQKSIV